MICLSKTDTLLTLRIEKVQNQCYNAIMCNFNKQNEQTKNSIHLFMKKASQDIGGVNFLLSLIEAIKHKNSNSLSEKSSQIASNNTIMKWNKVIFKDKVELLQSILNANKDAENLNFNILDEENPKRKKNILNMVKALAPVEFIVTPQNPNDGEGFNFKVFDMSTNDKAILNPIFMALFFCSIEFTKKAIKYEP